MARKPKLNGYFVNTLTKLGENTTNVYNSVVPKTLSQKDQLYIFVIWLCHSSTMMALDVFAPEMIFEIPYQIKALT